MTKTDICNLALTKLGTNTIATLIGDSLPENARRCNIIYDALRREVLRAHTWTFATLIKPLAVIAGEEIINYDYLYSYPADCLYIIKVYDESSSDVNNYKKMLSPDTSVVCIASNTEDAYIEYVKDIENVELFDDIFVQSFAARLASELAVPLTGELNLANKFLQEFQFEIQKAKKDDQQERHAIRNMSNPYVEVR